MKKLVRIDFCDFHSNFPKTDNFYYHLLSERFELQLCDQPDYLIFGPYGHEHRLHSGVRILASIEPGRPDYRFCDFSLSPLEIADPRHLQLPVYVTNGRAEELIKNPGDAEKDLAAKKGFCSFVVSSQHPVKNRNRLEIFEALGKYKRVDSGGRFMNNIGGPVPGGTRNKIEFLRKYKFNIAFENSSLPGYSTEKIYEPFAARSLPIYWGNPNITAEFNARAFLRLTDFPGIPALVEQIIELDKDDSKYLEFTRQPCFPANKPNKFFDHAKILDFFGKIFSSNIVPVAQAGRKKSLLGRWLFLKRHHWHDIPKPPSGTPA